MRLILLGLALALITYVAICAVLYALQRSMIYHPQPAATIAGVSLATFTARSAAIEIQYSVIQRSAGPGATAPAIVYFGGNAEHAGYAAADLAQLFNGHSVYALHYRGYSGSQGSPSEPNIIADAQQLYAFVNERHGSVIVIGRSLGSGVAIQVAATANARQPTKLVLLTPYDSIQNVAAKQFPVFPISLLLKDKFESWRYAPQVTAPTLVLAAEFDNVIARERTDALLPHFAAGLVMSKVITNTDHNSITQSQEYVKQLIAFVG
jgi:uncharacterized protein